MTSKALLVAAIASVVVYGLGDLASGLLYDGYSYRDQWVSELSAFGSPVPSALDGHSDSHSRPATACVRRSHLAVREAVTQSPHDARSALAGAVHVASAIGFCVRTVSHAPRNPGETPSFTGTLRCISMLREVVDEECVGACRCALLSATGINFQACSFNHSDISPFRINSLRAV